MFTLMCGVIEASDIKNVDYLKGFVINCPQIDERVKFKSILEEWDQSNFLLYIIKMKVHINVWCNWGFRRQKRCRCCSSEMRWKSFAKNNCPFLAILSCSPWHSTQCNDLQMMYRKRSKCNQTIRNNALYKVILVRAGLYWTWIAIIIHFCLNCITIP